MNLTFTDAEYRKMSSKERKHLMKTAEVVLRSTPNGELHDLDLEIQRFEKDYKLSSAEMRVRVAKGAMQETWEVCQWLMLLSRWERLAAKPNDEVRALDAQILAYEERLGMTTAQVRERLNQGLQEETMEICQWLLTAGLRDNLLKLREKGASALRTSGKAPLSGRS